MCHRAHWQVLFRQGDPPRVDIRKYFIFYYDTSLHGNQIGKMNQFLYCHSFEEKYEIFKNSKFTLWVTISYRQRENQIECSLLKMFRVFKVNFSNLIAFPYQRIPNHI